MVTKVRGAFNEFEGTAAIDGADPSKSTVSVTVQVASVDTRNEQRDGHLRTNDFLDVEQFPTITFASTAITHDGGDDFQVTGDLTIKGVTKSITIPLEFQGSAKDPFGNTRIGFEGSDVDQAQRLRRHLQRRARDRRRARQRQDHPRVRDLGHQVGLTDRPGVARAASPGGARATRPDRGVSRRAIVGARLFECFVSETTQYLSACQYGGVARTAVSEPFGAAVRASAGRAVPGVDVDVVDDPARSAATPALQ